MQTLSHTHLYITPTHTTNVLTYTHHHTHIATHAHGHKLTLTHRHVLIHTLTDTPCTLTYTHMLIDIPSHNQNTPTHPMHPHTFPNPHIMHTVTHNVHTLAHPHPHLLWSLTITHLYIRPQRHTHTLTGSTLTWTHSTVTHNCHMYPHTEIHTLTPSQCIYTHTHTFTHSNLEYTNSHTPLPPTPLERASFPCASSSSILDTCTSKQLRWTRPGLEQSILISILSMNLYHLLFILINTSIHHS